MAVRELGLLRARKVVGRTAGCLTVRDLAKLEAIAEMPEKPVRAGVSRGSRPRTGFRPIWTGLGPTTLLAG